MTGMTPQSTIMILLEQASELDRIRVRLNHFARGKCVGELELVSDTLRCLARDIEQQQDNLHTQQLRIRHLSERIRDGLSDLRDGELTGCGPAL